MIQPDEFSNYYRDFLEGTYDCVDRIVLNAYFPLAQSCGGFRTWWRRLTGGDDNLDNAHLMRIAGRFSRRIHAYAKKHGIPIIHCQRGQSKHEIAESYMPSDPGFIGTFCILVGRAPASVFEVKRFDSGAIDIKKKRPLPYVNYYSFHIMDPDWGHIIIKLCPHPPFSAQLILNGHEYVANQARKNHIPFTKIGNCFTDISVPENLNKVAETMKASSFVGLLIQVCERWLYSACLCFALSFEDQQKSGFHYAYSVYQAEYSRNLLFTLGQTLERVFQGVIDRTRAALEMKTVKTIFGYTHRPFKKRRKGNKPLRGFEVAVERPVYDLTVFKVHFGKLTAKIYSKGERVLRVEIIAHNTKDLRCGKVIEKFPQIIKSLEGILERFLSVLRSIDVSFLDASALETWHLPSQVGSSRIGGINTNQPRIRAVMKAVVALSKNPRGFTSSEVSIKVKGILNGSDIMYDPRQASYDLKKLRGKDLVQRIEHTHRYEVPRKGLRSMMAYLTLRDKVLMPLLARSGKLKTGPKGRNRSEIDIHYENIQKEMKRIFEIMNMAA